ncbi:MAG TPA: chemotaxis protein CheA [Arcobacter sp.]|nr:chemotaxis protein CheA [Arcobacter sp.]
MSGFDISMYRDMFLEEAEELFESADNVLLEAEKNGSLTDDEMSQLFRDVHTLKGSGASVELAYFAEFTHDVENLMDKLRNHEIEFRPEMADTLISGLDVMREILQMECDEEIDRDTFTDMSTELLATIRGYMNGEIVPEPVEISVQEETTIESVDEVVSNQSPQTQNTSYGFFAETDSLPQEKVEIAPVGDKKPGAYGFFGEDTLDSSATAESDEDFGFFDMAEEITPESTIETSTPTATTSVKETPKVEAVKEETKIEPTLQEAKKVEKTAVETKATPTKKAPIKKKEEKKSAASNNIRVNLDKIDNLMNNVGDLVITNAMLTQFASTINENKTRNSVLERLELLERHIREMQDSIMSIRMVPMESIYSKFPKVVRDISKKLSKKVEFKHDGDSVEIDKAMIEGLTDPLMHIIRNSLDHGLEIPEDRRASGKNETGIIEIAAEQANGQMIITIKDDGKGIDAEKVALKSLDNGLIDENQYNQMSDNDKAMLIFGAGVSTAKEVTEISGRGVGMDVVKTNIQKLGGVIKLDTEVGVGTTITIMLPLTLAILDGLDIAVGEMKYILPLSSIVESLQPTSEMIKRIGDGSQDLLMLREEFIPIVRLHKLFSIEAKHNVLEDGMLIVVKTGNQKIALFIDEFLHQHQVVVKPLDKNFKAVEGIGAATVRGDGSIGLIMDIVGLIEVQKMFDNGTITEDISQKVS